MAEKMSNWEKIKWTVKNKRHQAWRWKQWNIYFIIKYDCDFWHWPWIKIDIDRHWLPEFNPTKFELVFLEIRLFNFGLMAGKEYETNDMLTLRFRNAKTFGELGSILKNILDNKNKN